MCDKCRKTSNVEEVIELIRGSHSLRSIELCGNLTMECDCTVEC